MNQRNYRIYYGWEGNMQVEAKGERVKKELDHIRVHRAMDGGHIVEHHHRHFAHPPESHHFKPHEHHKMIGHLVKHLGLELELPKTEEERQERDVG